MARYTALKLSDAIHSAWSVTLTTAKDPALHRAILAKAIGPLAGEPPAVFENTSYTITVTPSTGWQLVSVGHRVRQDVADAFEPLLTSEGVDWGWHGTLNMGNDLGWFFLELELCRVGASTPLLARAGWQVWPLKLNYASDLKVMIEQIEATYPLWLFRFDTPTVHDAGSSSASNQGMLLLWFAQFDRLWAEFEHGLKTIVQNPHVRLDGQPAQLRADRLQGRLGRRLAEAVVTHRRIPEKTHPVQLWRSSRDTPENRFVHQTIVTALSALEKFSVLVDSPNLSENFRSHMDARLRRLRAFRADPLFRGLGSFSGLLQESLVLHHRVGYSDVYRIWLELRHGLEFFAQGSNTQIGMRSVNELYEIWCFLELRTVLQELGFDEVRQDVPRWKDVRVERQLAEGQGARFEYQGHGIAVRLSHEPTFGKSRAGLRSYTVSQRPDIVLEAGGMLWIFDAKYRLKSPGDDPHNDLDGGRTSEWLVPPDALNQMHRYRDSIILTTEGKSRPVVSAFALFPSPVDQSLPADTNPYWIDTQEVGIGAFPLVPKPDGSGRRWLTEYLRECLSLLESGSETDVLDQPHVQIPVTGLSYRDRDLLFIPVERLMSEPDLDALREGRAQSVELPRNFRPDRTRLAKVTFVGFVLRADPGHLREVTVLYQVKDGWPEPGETLKLGLPLAPPSPVALTWSGGSWFRYADVRTVLENPANYP